MGRKTMQGAVSGEIRRATRHDRRDDHACEQAYDDEQDHIRCTDCKGTGWYIGFTERRYCPTCDGSGYV